MAETLLTFGPTDTAETLGVPVVYSRARWADDWDEQADCYPDEVVWSVSPAMPAATLLWNYGRLQQLDGTEPTLVKKLTWQPGRYVKIEVPCDLDSEADPPTFRKRYWYGLVEQIIDDQQGAFERVTRDERGEITREWVATGTQRVICHGLEQLLARHRIRTAAFDRGGGVTRYGAPISFNAHAGRGNRGTTEYDDAYVFWYDLDSGSGSVTSWSTREIVRYLLRFQNPRDHLGAPAIKWRVNADCLDRLPNWDLPFLDQDNATTLGLLQRLLTRQRLYSFWFDVDEGDNVVELHVDSIVPNEVALTISPTAKIPAANRLLRLDYDQDPATRGHVRDSELGLYDVIVARGAPLVSVASFSLLDGALQKGWSAGNQTRYEYGAEGSVGFSTASLAEKQRRHAAARSDPRLEDVFSRFVIPPSWDQKTSGGRPSPRYDVFTGASGPVPIYFPSMALRPSLPLYPGVDYSTNAVTSGTAATNEPKGDVEKLPVQSYWRRPALDADGNQRWFRGDEIGRLAALEGVSKADAERITIHTHVVPNSKSIVFRAGNGHQHAIAHGEFNPRPEDEKQGQWTYRNGQAIVTVAIDWGMRVEGQWQDIPGGGKDALRYLVIEAGEQYERVFVVPGTVVGIDVNGQLLRSNGGWLERPTSVVTRLNDLAHLAHAWYSIPHKIVTVETARLLSAASIHLGDLVARVGDPSIEDNPHELVVNASVTEIRIRWEQGTDVDSPPGPSMTIQTFAGELDALAVGPAAFEGPGNPFRARRTIRL